MSLYQTEEHNQLSGWLIENGVDKGRLTAKGYGENQLINKC
jgi:outer membrane protein OmpA-like peptidoglycan-associated protein